MEEPKHILSSPCNNPNSPEFEFWMVRNPSFPQPILHSADELFSDGVLLPLHHLRLSDDPPEFPGSGQTRKPDPTTTNSSKRWRDIFKRSDKKINTSSASCENDSGSKVKGNSVNKEKKREKKINGGAGGFGAGPELNIINMWPFTRSRSAGNGGARPRSTAAGRKVSSAPCSRSNSAGESKSRKLASSSPGRVGVHLGRTSPVWQARRSTGTEKVVKKDGRRIPTARLGGGGPKASVLNLNVPVSIGYRHHLSCKSDHENSAVSIPANASGGGGVSGEGLRGGSNFFNIRSLFTKKVY